MDSKNGLLSSGHKLLKFIKRDTDGEKVYEHFHYLLLESLMKTREIDLKESLAAAALQ